jgi:hypothetical protein
VVIIIYWAINIELLKELTIKDVIASFGSFIKDIAKEEEGMIKVVDIVKEENPTVVVKPAGITKVSGNCLDLVVIQEIIKRVVVN